MPVLIGAGFKVHVFDLLGYGLSERPRWQVVAWARKLHDAIPDSELHVLNDCGHFAMEDKPAEVGQLLLSFLAKHYR